MTPPEGNAWRLGFTPSARRRLILGFAFSALLHWVMLSAVSIRAPFSAETTEPLSRTLQARLTPSAPSDIEAVPATAPETRRPDTAVVEEDFGETPGETSGESSVAENVVRQDAGTDAPGQRLLTKRATAAEYDPRPALDTALIVDTTIYDTRDLDVLPRPLSPINPVYPASPFLPVATGRVTLELVIDERGRVWDAVVIEASPVADFESAALESLQSARFSPAQRDGHAVRSRLVIEVEFRPDATLGH